MSQNRDVVEQKGNQILHIRGDSDSDLEALFKAAMNPKDSQVPLPVPMRLRKLPNSFFKPPETGSKSVSHSRESSSDSTQFSSPSGLPIHHPRAHSSPASLQQTYSSNTQQHQHLRQQSYDITDDIPLPPGWEMAKTASGQRYFLNHIDQTTTWHDPRKSLSATNLSQLSQQALGPLPEGWEQATSPEGEVYYINHTTHTTSWFDPRLPLHPQRSEAQSSQQVALQQRQQKLRLQRLQMERERLRVRQQEIMRQAQATLSLLGPGPVTSQQELMIRRTLGEEMNISSTTDPSSSSSTTGLDPFLGGTDYHSRQESADSGLGMGTSYSLPHTPEDFLSNMDDSTEDVGRTNQQREFPLDSMQGSNLDLGELNSNDNTANMEGEDLVPSLQEELSTDIDITDVEAVLNTNKLDNLLTWL